MGQESIGNGDGKGEAGSHPDIKPGRSMAQEAENDDPYLLHHQDPLFRLLVPD